MIEISNINLKELDVYARLTENQLYHYREPELGVFIAESPNVIQRALDAGYEPISFLVDRHELKGQTLDLIEQYEDVPAYVTERGVLENLTGFAMTRGMLCAMNRRKLPFANDLCAKSKRIVILEDVVNPTNVGAIFRSAAALYMDAVILTGGCSDPLYRRAARVSMGTVFQVPWTMLDKKQKWTESFMDDLHTMGFKTVAMALRDDSVSLDDPWLMKQEKLAIVMGTEGDGLASSTIARCDFTVKIPMSNEVDSLNVAAASAVAFWQLGNRK